MTHDEMVQGIANGIRQGRIVAIVRKGALVLFTDQHIGTHVTEQEAKTAVTAEQYLKLSEADHAAPWN